MSLFALLGSGEWQPWTDEVDRWLLERTTGDGTVLVLPTASAPEGMEKTSHQTRSPGGTMPARMMVGAMSLTQSALAGIFASSLPAPDALAASVSWNKLLLVQLNALLLGYLAKEHR